MKYMSICFQKIRLITSGILLTISVAIMLISICFSYAISAITPTSSLLAFAISEKSVFSMYTYFQSVTFILVPFNNKIRLYFLTKFLLYLF